MYTVKWLDTFTKTITVKFNLNNSHRIPADDQRWWFVSEMFSELAPPMSELTRV